VAKVAAAVAAVDDPVVADRSAAVAAAGRPAVVAE